MLRIKNKSGAHMSPSTYLLMALGISLVITASWMVLADFQTAYPEIEINSTWQHIYEKAKAVSAEVNSTTGTLRNATARMQEGGVWGTMIGGFLMLSIIPQMGRLVLTGIVGVLDIVVATMTEMGAPGIIIGVIITALVIIVLFGVISAIWKYKEV